MSRRLLTATDQLCAALAPLSFGPPVTHVYNPLEYARAPWDVYCERYGQGRREVILLGMNPGPFGMAQVGVPFGEVAAARGWLGIDAPVGRPANEHPKRPILGFGCTRSEVSGRRFWGWAEQRFGSPGAFFARFFVANYCPLVFMEDSGRNRTPDKLPVAERAPLFEACDQHLRRVVRAMEPRWVIGVGAFAAARARAALADTELEVGQILHPSPASPAANKDWVGKVTAQLAALGLVGDAVKKRTSS